MPEPRLSLSYDRSIDEIAKDWSGGGASKDRLMGLLHDGTATYLVFLLETSVVRGVTGFDTAVQCLQLLEKVCSNESTAPFGTTFAADADALKTALEALRRLPKPPLVEAAFSLILQLLSLESERVAALAEGTFRLSLEWLQPASQSTGTLSQQMASRPTGRAPTDRKSTALLCRTVLPDAFV